MNVVNRESECLCECAHGASVCVERARRSGYFEYAILPLTFGTNLTNLILDLSAYFAP